MDPSLPVLPTISGDPNIMLDVYTHSTVRHTGGTSDPEYGNPERLAELGKRMLDLAVTYHFFRLTPHLSAVDIAARKDDTLSDDAIVRWIEGYGLKNKIRAFPHTILDDPNELRIFFYTFIGALYIRNGIHEVQDWISHLIDPDHEPDPMPSPPQQQQQQQTQGMPTQPSQPPPPSVRLFRLEVASRIRLAASSRTTVTPSRRGALPTTTSMAPSRHISPKLPLGIQIFPMLRRASACS
jgi:dsRNA-specific ribonuclease